MRREVEKHLGHSLEVKDSAIDHHLAGKGVFLSCREQGIVLPGTLLGIFPGVINPPATVMPPTPKRGVRPYIRRPDGFWIDYETELPYPMPPQGSNYLDYIEQVSFVNELQGIKAESAERPIRATPEMINPFALGHIVNHPPPDIAANVKLVDFDLPYTFFPSYMGRYIPYINGLPFEQSRLDNNSTRTTETMRAVAMVAQNTMANGDELYIDYIEENRTEIDYTPDWLL